MPVKLRHRKRGRPRNPDLLEQRREEILHAATAVFAREGYRCTDLQRVADVLGVGKGTLYRYFPTKQDLFQGAVDRVMVGMRDAVDRAIEDVKDPLEAISRAIRAYLAFFHDHPEYVELLIQERAEFRDRKKPTYFAYREANRGRWLRMYMELIDEGRIRRMQPERIMDVIGDLIYGTMFTNYMAGRTRSLVEQADEILDMVFLGLLTEKERRERRGANGK